MGCLRWSEVLEGAHGLSCRARCAQREDAVVKSPCRIVRARLFCPCADLRRTDAVANSGRPLARCARARTAV